MACMVPGTETTRSLAFSTSRIDSGLMLAMWASPVRVMATRVLSSGTSKMTSFLKCGVPRQWG